MDNKKKVLLGTSIFVAIVLVAGISYALWTFNIAQTDVNAINSSCFKIEFQDENPIELTKTYPITNEEGLNLIPYEFTITNTCDNYATYQINLEILNNTTFGRHEYIKTSLNELEGRVLTNLDSINPTLASATTSYKLENGYLDKLEAKTFTLRIWLDENTPLIDEVMNKEFVSKVTINTSYLLEAPSYAEAITNCTNNGYRSVDCMLENSKYDTVNLAYDETADNNLRYIGASPNNYVEFNNELWRIIGVMNNIEDENGNEDSRIKLIRDESIGDYSWDTSASNINYGWGINEWSQADLMKLLNPGYEAETIGGSLYWNRTSGTCYGGQNNATKSCNFTTSGLLEESKGMIDTVLWHLGARNTGSQSVDTLEMIYNAEKGNQTGKACTGGNSCNDTVPRTTTWMGKLGLINTSDFGYTVLDNKVNGNNSCFDIPYYLWRENKICYKNSWLIDEEKNIWAITPSADGGKVTATYATVVGYIETNIGVQYSSVTYKVKPVIYLKNNFKITSGTGTKENAFKLGLS